MNLYPYNFYILYAAAAVLLIMLVMTGIRLLNAMKTIRDMAPVLEKMKKQGEEVKVKMAAVEEKKNKTMNNLKIAMLVVPLVYAIFQKYKEEKKNNEEIKYREIANYVIRDKATRNLVRGEVQRMLSR